MKVTKTPQAVSRKKAIQTRLLGLKVGMVFYLISGMTLFFFVAYAVIAILFPEWVGITGKKAKEIEAEQREDTTKNEN